MISPWHFLTFGHSADISTFQVLQMNGHTDRHDQLLYNGPLKSGQRILTKDHIACLTVIENLIILFTAYRYWQRNYPFAASFTTDMFVYCQSVPSQGVLNQSWQAVVWRIFLKHYFCMPGILNDPFWRKNAAETANAFEWVGQPSKIASFPWGIWTPI